MRSKRRILGAALLWASLLTLVYACDDDVIAPANNAAPQTEVSASSPRSLGEVFTVDFFFSGSDADGRVEFFEWRVLENSAEDPPWTRTEDSDLTLSFPSESEDLGFENPGPNRMFQVRAVDESGLGDPTPAAVSFTPLTLTPEIMLSMPVQLNSCTQSSPAMTFRWTATDADSKSGAPEFVRYLLKKYGNPEDPCLLRMEYELGAFPILNDDEAWSNWIRYDAPLDSGMIARFPPRPASDVGTSYVFVVQARDIDGATNRVFAWGRQFAHVKISDTKSPLLAVSEPTLGTEYFHRLSIVKTYEINPGQALDFSWFAEAHYFSEITGYRYGWDLVDPNDALDPGWAVDWGDWTEAPTQSFDTGAHNFVVQVRDRANVITRATYVLNVGEPPGIPELTFRLFMDVGTGPDPVWELRWVGNSQGPEPDSPDGTPVPFAGFERRFKIEWEASSPNGPIIGYRYRTEQGSDAFWPADSGGEKQWDPTATSFVFANAVPPSSDIGAGCGADAVGCDPALVRFASGNYDITVEALDAALVESEAGAGDLDFAVNYTPETRLVEDASYPRFEVRDPSGQLLSTGSIASGDTIPAMSTVLFRSTGYDRFMDELPLGVPSDSLCCDTPWNYDPSLLPGDPGYVPQVQYQSRLVTVRREGSEEWGRTTMNLFSVPDQGDTISFWAGPLDYTYHSRTVDEHRRPDTSAETFELVGGFLPRVREDLMIPGGEIPSNEGDVADTLLVNLFQGQSWADNEIPYTAVQNAIRWWLPDPSSECGGTLVVPDGGQPPEGAVEQVGVLVQVSLKFVGSEDPRDPLSPVRAWSYAIFNDKDPDNWLEDGLESRDLSYFTDSTLPNEWQFGPGQTIDIWVPINLSFFPERYHPSSELEMERSIGCIVAKRMGEMSLQVRGRTTENLDEYRLYDGTRKTPGANAVIMSIGEYGRQSDTAELSCSFLVGGGFDGSPTHYWPDF